ncbi:hypothetical protein [Lentzea cavernae]|uniref:Uncharacterized protein n=1 Tax=Lentzea cavernae TaxID=2020703 RepID=A0ABQ3MRY6_9PSEU|nr:hypothetical protein [Lentzea cavernae]GHH59796.1 hypothetical protein GCM10017774_83180 [Lentzea cavernae]
MPTDLFGFENEPVAAPVPPSSPVTNDMRVIMDVLNRAVMETGYVLAGASRRVYRRIGKDGMKRVPQWELDAVLQCIDSGQLTVGGTHLLRCGAVRQSASSVTVPKATRQKVMRWNSLMPLVGTPAGDEKKGA